MVPAEAGENNYSRHVNGSPSFPLPRIREAAKTHKLVEQELAHSVNATALVLTEAKLSSPEVRQPPTGEEKETGGVTYGGRKRSSGKKSKHISSNTLWFPAGLDADK